MTFNNLTKSFGVLVMASIVASCSVDLPKETHTSYETMIVEKSDLVIPIKYSSRLKGKRDVTITPQVSGQLLKVCVDPGQHVKKGETLFVIDDRQARLELQTAEANLSAAIAQMNSAELEYTSNKNLFDKQIVSSYMLNTAENAFNQAKAAVAQARAVVDRARLNLSFCTIKASEAGVVGDVPATAGDQVGPASVLTTVSANAEVRATFALTEDELNSILAENKDKGRENYLKELPDVTFVMKDGTEYGLKGRINDMSGVVDHTTGTAQVSAVFPNPDGVLHSGIQGTVVFPFSAKNVMVIPQTAVVRLQDKSLVYKVTPDSCAASVQITTMDAGTGKDVVVLSGLNVGDQIVTIGANNVVEGQKVLFGEEKKK